MRNRWGRPSATLTGSLRRAPFAPPPGHTTISAGRGTSAQRRHRPSVSSAPHPACANSRRRPPATGDNRGPSLAAVEHEPGLASALLTAGALSDDFGRRRIFLVGAVLLTVSSVGCAIAPTTVVFVLARIAQCIGAAALAACNLGIIAAAVPAGPARQRATGIWGASVGAGIAVGPLLAAGSEPTLGWRAVYWLLTALSVALAVAARTAAAKRASS